MGTSPERSRPLVSVVVPFYNRAHCLAKAIDSVLEQSFEHWELVLVDDGSTDDSLKIARRYEARDPRRIRILQQPNQGVAAARNRAIESAEGELVGILDSDDEWAPSFLTSTTEAFRQFPELDWVYVNARRMDAEGRVLVPSVFDDDRSAPFRSLATRRNGTVHIIVDDRLLHTAISGTIKVGANSLVRRDVFRRHPYPLGISVGEDRVVVIAAIAAGFRFGYVDEILLTVNAYGDNASAGKQARSELRRLHRQLIRANELIRDEVPLDRRCTTAIRRQLTHHYYAVAVSLLEDGSYLEALPVMARSLLSSPLDHPAYAAVSRRLRRVQ